MFTAMFIHHNWAIKLDYKMRILFCCNYFSLIKYHH